MFAVKKADLEKVIIFNLKGIVCSGTLGSPGVPCILLPRK